MRTTATVVMFLSVLAPLLAPSAASAEPAPLKADRPLALDVPAPATSPSGAAAAAPDAADPTLRGKALETMDAASYTYVRVETDGGEQWIAGPSTSVKVGDVVAWPAGSDEMKNFQSKTLDRTFDSILFVSRIVVFGSEAKAASAAPHAGLASPGDDADDDEIIEGIPKADGGWTVAEIFEQKDQLAGKPVVVRARVVKFNGAVMGRNWLHLRDGSSSSDGDNDLTVTSQDRASVGDTVLVRGTLVTDKDFGFGYRYAVLVENARIEVEPAAAPAQ